MDDSAQHTLNLACPYHWYCNQRIWHSADDVNNHLTVTHAGIYQLSWPGIPGRSQMKISRGKDGCLKCKWKGCRSSVTGSIHSLLNHLKIEHDVKATYEAKNVPTLPWPPVTADELVKWSPKRGPTAVRVELPPSQSQGAPSNQGIRSTHAVGRRSPQTFNHVPRGPEMDQAGLPSVPSSAHDDVPPPHTPLRKLPAPALSQLRRSPAQEVSPDLRQQSQLLSQRPSQQSKTQGQQPSSSRERTDSMTALEMLSNLRQNGWLSSQRQSRQSETQGQQPSSSRKRTDPMTALEASSNLRQNGSPLSQRPSRQSETQGQQPSSSRERTGPMTALEALNNLRQNGSPLSQRPSRQSETQAQQLRSSQKIGSLRLTTPSPRFHGPLLDFRTMTSPSPPSKLRRSPLSQRPLPPSVHSQSQLLSERPRAAPSAPSAPSFATNMYSSPANGSLSPNAFALDASQVSSFNGVCLKRDRSPSPVQGSSKRARLESPCFSPSVISRVASFMMTPLKRGANLPASGPTVQGTSYSRTQPAWTPSPRRRSLVPDSPANGSFSPTAAVSSRNVDRTDAAPTSLKRQLSPSPTNGSSKRPRHENSHSSPSFMSRFVNLVKSPFQVAANSPAASQSTSGSHPPPLPNASSRRPSAPPQPAQGTTVAETESNGVYTKKKELEEDLMKRGAVRTKADLAERKFGSPPVEGIAYVRGFACDQCRKGWTSRDEAVVHCREKHEANNVFFTECKIQSILHPQFKKGGVHWVRVVPGTNRDPADAFTAYQATWAVEHRRRPNIIPGPVNSNGVALLAKLTGWLDYLAVYIETENDVQGLKSLTDVVGLPRHPDFAILPAVIDEYSNQSCAIVHNMEAHTRYMLTECPRTKETDYFNMPSLSTRNRYRNTLTTFTFALLTSTDTNKTQYRFPLTDLQKSAVRNMQARFRANSNHVPTDRTEAVKALVNDLHSLLRAFLIGREGPSRSKFGSVFECFLAVFAVESRGILCKADKLSSVCSAMKFWTRMCTVFETDERLAEAPGLDFETVFTDLAMKNLNVTVQSEFTRLTTNAKLFATLVYGTVRPPNMRVSPDYLDFTCDLTTLHLPALRAKIPAAVGELKMLLEELHMGIKIPVTYPAVFKDDWTTEEAGDSFLRYNEFFDEDGPWIRGLFQSHAVGLASRSFNGSLRYDHNGKLMLDSHVVNDILNKDRAFIELAVVLCYVTSSGARGEEFAEARLENGDRPRSFLVDSDGECTLATRRLKTETITKKTTFIPSVIPREISELLLRYLIVIRPGINELVRMHCGEVPAVRQAEFLWVSRGKVYDGDKVGDLLEGFTGDRLGVAIGRQPWRQIMTEVMRVYFDRSVFNENTEGLNIHDARMGRSSQASHAHYGINESRHMSSDQLLEFRAGSLEVHQIMGLGDAGKRPLIPCRLQRVSLYMAGAYPQPGVVATSSVSADECGTLIVAALRDSEARMSSMFREEVGKFRDEVRELRDEVSKSKDRDSCLDEVV
ncbi:hypothetical protein B0H19DRAFT_1384645 [Mycena capillaripes]|nr:hypothetical protein B0H19DRAFT_1384645 [Mycena capillaripes]